MDSNYYTALVGLAGAAIGGMTSFGSTWISQHLQARARAREVWHARRERLYTAFIEETSRLFGDALSHENDDVTSLVKVYAIVARMRLIASAPVMAAAEDVVLRLIQAYQQPNRTLHDLHLFAREGGLDPLLAFSEACRNELS